MEFSTKPPRARQFDEKIVDALHRLNALFLKSPPIGRANQAEGDAVCALLADAAVEGRRCRRTMDELVQNALHEEVARAQARAADRAAAAAQPVNSATIIQFPSANAVRPAAAFSAPPIVA